MTALVDWQSTVAAGALVMLRLSGIFMFAPIFSSPAISSKIKAGLVFAMTLLLAPLMVLKQGAISEISVQSVLGELAVGLIFGLTLSLLNEAVLFASTLLGMEFSFSLVNLVDPVSKVETPVLGQLLGWVTTLVLLGAGLHRTLLYAVMQSFTVVPLGTFAMAGSKNMKMAQMAGGIFFAGVQLASPVLAAGLVVTVTVALVGRISPQLPTTILSVPLKTMVSYGVLIGSLAVWPMFLERKFDVLLSAAAGMLGRG